MEQEVKMETQTIVPLADRPHRSARSRQSRTFRRLLASRMFVTGAVIVAIITVIALIGPLCTSYDPLAMKIQDRLKGPSYLHWFGTDSFGRDILSRVMYGSRISMGVGISVVLVSSFAGILIGIISAFYRAFDNLIMRINDGLMAFPEILLAISIVAALGPGKKNVIIALSIVYTPLVARVVRAEAIVEREKVYVEAIRVLGASPWRIMLRHILPNCLSPYVIQITFIFAYSIIVEASLSFLGAGTPPPIPSWGNILNEGMSVMREAWWVTVFPGIFVLVTVLGLNLLGDGLRDILDPSVNKK
jgi:peptide/nickel transport system permease protein